MIRAAPGPPSSAADLRERRFADAAYATLGLATVTKLSVLVLYWALRDPMAIGPPAEVLVTVGLGLDLVGVGIAFRAHRHRPLLFLALHGTAFLTLLATGTGMFGWGGWIVYVEWSVIVAIFWIASLLRRTRFRFYLALGVTAIAAIVVLPSLVAEGAWVAASSVVLQGLSILVGLFPLCSLALAVAWFARWRPRFARPDDVAEIFR